MKYVTASGKTLNDKDFDEMAREYETGDWEGKLGTVTIGRPKLSDEEARPISFKLPVSRIAAIDRVIEQSGQSRSEFIRDAVDQALVSKLANS